MYQWFAHLTFANPGGATSWDHGWYNHTQYPSQGGLPSLRYQLSFVAYAAAVMSFEATPAYPELAGLVLGNAFDRLLLPEVWRFWSETRHTRVGGRPYDLCHENRLGSEWCPDPVYYENIMYSGHLAQVLALYESFTNDTASLSDTGWSFDYNESVRFDYNASQLMDRILFQALEDDTGGICCEPSLVYTPCNNHPRAAFSLFDAVHGTNYSTSNERYEAFLPTAIRRGRDDRDGFFQIIWQRNVRRWVDIAGLGGCASNDGWVLSMLPAWSDNATMLAEGLESLRNDDGWTTANATDDDGGGGGKYIAQGPLYESYHYTWELATSFYPVVERQVDSASSSLGDDALAYLRRFSVRGPEGLHFDTSPEMRVWVTSNVALALSIAPGTLRRLHTEPVFAARQDRPWLKSVTPAYPAVFIRRADWEDSGALSFSVLPGVGLDAAATVNLTVANPPNAPVVLRDGETWSQWNTDGTSLWVFVEGFCNESSFIIQ